MAKSQSLICPRCHVGPCVCHPPDLERLHVERLLERIANNWTPYDPDERRPPRRVRDPRGNRDE